MIVDRFRAMGTTVETWSPTPTVATGIRNLFAEVEERSSRFSTSSELSRLNRSCSGAPVSPLLAEVLRAAEAARLRTGGLVDAGMGGTVAAWGYDRSFDAVDGIDEPPPAAVPTDWWIEGNCVHRNPGTLLDLGGVAKGWTCDRAVERLGATMANAGGDLRSADPETQVVIRTPDGDDAATVRVGIGALATSSTGHRRWRVGHEMAHHLIDPRTGAPAVSPVVSATVVATTAAAAESGAKAVLLHGASGLAWASRQPWIRGALTVWHDGSIYATRGMEIVS